MNYKISKQCIEHMKYVQKNLIDDNGYCVASGSSCRRCLLCCLSDIVYECRDTIDIDDICKDITISNNKYSDEIKIKNIKNGACDTRFKNRKNVRFILSNMFTCNL